MLLGAFMFAVMGAFAHAAGPYCDWQVIALARAGLALVFAVLLAWAARTTLVLWRPRSLWIRSIAGSFSLVCTFSAFPRLPLADVLTLTNMFPVWVAILSWPLLRIAPTRQVWLSVASGIAGVVLIQQPHLAEGNFATLAALVSSFSSALAMIGLHRLHRIDPWAIVVHFSAVSLVFVAASFLLFERSIPINQVLDPATLGLLFGVGATATIAQLALTKAFTTGAPAKVSVVGLTQVGFGMLFDTMIWGRTFSGITLVGIALVTAPTAWLLTTRKKEPRSLNNRKRR
jgi:drug/metabolite transporter (DMT)-like permease